MNAYRQCPTTNRRKTVKRKWRVEDTDERIFVISYVIKSVTSKFNRAACCSFKKIWKRDRFLQYSSSRLVSIPDAIFQSYIGQHGAT